MSRNIAAILAIAMLTASTLSAQTRKQCIDDDWQFQYGEQSAIPTATESWRRLDLPHDWSVETDAANAQGGTVIGPFNKASVGTTQTGYTVGGEGWYKKTFTLTPEQKGKLISIYFEGVYNYATIYINGTQVYFNPYGYTSFRVDVTPYLKPVGEENTMLVKVENEGVNSRWYAGSGIFRHVWMMTKPKTHLDEWGTIVAVDNEGLIASGWQDATVNIQTTVMNEQLSDASGTVNVTLTDNKGNSVGTGTASYSAKSMGEAAVNVNVSVTSPQLWSPETPTLYHAHINLHNDDVDDNVDDDVDDNLDIPFGIRSISISATEGFLLNGKNVLLHGGCVHHDNGLLGAAQWDAAEARKIKLLKAQGYNALRGSHNMQSENFLYLCDSLGMMALDECFDQWYLKKNTDDYHQFFPEYHTRDLQVMLKRDINHPSIIIWGIGNEIPGRCEEKGKAVAAEMRSIIKSYDTVRPVTAAICGWDEGDEWNAQSHNWNVQDANAFLSLDLGGYNYMYSEYEHDHGTHPDRVMCGLESYPKQSSQNWDLVEQKPYVIGDFVWTAMDYLGEAGIGSANWSSKISMFQRWPWFNGWCGDIDLIGQRKPQSYYHDVVWHRAPITMAVEQPHSSESISAWGWQQEHQSWTWPDYTSSDKMVVNVYSRAPKVRLYLNGKKVGEGTPGSTYWCGFSVGYAEGTLRAVNVENGQETDSFELVTTGSPAAVRLTADRDAYNCDGRDLVYVTAELVDEEGRVITSNSTQKITFSVEGEGTLLASGTASPNDMNSFRNPSVTLFEGRALAIIRTTSTAGDIKISVNASDPELSRTLIVHTSKSGIYDDISSTATSSCTPPADEQIYDLTGLCVGNDSSALRRHPHGIYIIGGKKVIMK